MHHKSATALAGLLLAASSASAFARPAIAMFNANLRSGPGVENSVVAVIPDSAPIDVGRCAGSWCRVSWNGVDGYLSRSLIASSASARRPRGVEGESDAAPPVVGDDRAAYARPACDPSVDPNCGGGYPDSSAYNGGYDNGYPYDDYAYSGYGYDPGLYGGAYIGGYGGGYADGRYGGGRFYGGNRAANIAAGARGPGGAPIVGANTQGVQGGPGRVVGGGQFRGGRFGGGNRLANPASGPRGPGAAPIVGANAQGAQGGSQRPMGGGRIGGGRIGGGQVKEHVR
jgi:uncharacterized protein YraI